MPPPAPAERLLKRYENRKLYEPAGRRYVTVAEVRALVAAGDDVRVVEQKSGEDITAQVLAQALLEGLRERTATIPRQALVALIRLSAGKGAWGDWPDAHAAAARLRSEAERIAAGLLSRGRLSLDEALHLRHEIAAALHGTLDHTQRALEQRLRGLVPPQAARRRVNPALGQLKRRLSELDTALARDGTPPAGRARRRAARRD